MAVDLYQFAWGVLAWTTTVTLFPGSVLMAALAFRIWRESRDTDIEGAELWQRAFLAWAALALIMVGFVAVDWALADYAEFPPGPIHLVILIGFVALASWVMFYMFSLDDYFEGLSLAAVYLFVPVIALFLLNAALGLLSTSMRFWDPVVEFVKVWLIKPT
jgi:hypothetical protein